MLTKSISERVPRNECHARKQRENHETHENRSFSCISWFSKEWNSCGTSPKNPCAAETCGFPVVYLANARSGAVFVLTVSVFGTEALPAGVFCMNINDEIGTVPLIPPQPPANPPRIKTSASQDIFFTAFNISRINFRLLRSLKGLMSILRRLARRMQTISELPPAPGRETNLRRPRLTRHSGRHAH